MKVLLFVFALFFALVLSVVEPSHSLEIDHAFTQFQADFKKVYNPTELNFRKKAFAHNLKKIAALRLANPHAVFEVNKFSDLTHEEFSKMYLMPNYANTGIREGAAVVEIPNINADLPTAYDWNTHVPNPITPIKDQGQCGSCWAFSATEEIESAWILAGHNTSLLSVQQIVDCDKGLLTLGCDGGETTAAYNYVKKAGGLEPELAYPYTAKNGKCEDTTSSPKVAKITDWKYATTKKNETELLYALAQVAPISICVNANSAWDSYKSGIITGNCESIRLNHCVQLTGYGVADSIPYWVVRNSWGESWGEKGYIRLARGSNVCGVANEPTIVVV